MKSIAIILIPLFFLSCISSRIMQERKKWCLSKCDAAGDEKENTEAVYKQMERDSVKDIGHPKPTVKFPLRIGIVQSDTLNTKIKKALTEQAIYDLNTSFATVGFAFYIEKIDIIISSLHIEDLSKKNYRPYNDFSDEYDIDNMISVYIFDHGSDFCTISDTRISCRRRGSFSYILSNRTNNIVLSTFDLKDQKIVAHEFGHFFGLYHTFEEAQFGKDDFDADKCHLTGDRICDTPPDPGDVFEVYVNYSSCEMLGLKNEQGIEYKPLIQNYMSYYKPCYLKEYSFTPGQIAVMQAAGKSELRKRFSR